MAKNLLILVMSALLAISCAKKISEKTADKQVRQLKSFTKLNVKGEVDLVINTRRPKNQVILTGDPRDLKHVKTEVIDGMLMVSVDPRYPKYGKLKTQVNTRYLNLLAYNGHGHIHSKRLYSNLFEADITNDGSVNLSGKIGLRKLRVSGEGVTTIHGISSRNLSIEMIESPKVNLRGFAKLKNLEYTGAGYLNAYWINSPELTVKGSGYGTIQLAGKVNELHLELRGHAKFKGRYLRAKRGFIKTYGRSLAEV